MEALEEPYRRTEIKEEWVGLSQNIETVGHVRVISQKEYVYIPKVDITTFELALIMPIFYTQYNIEKAIEALPLKARRHFGEVREVK